jgi:hypothetical protein
MKTIVNITLASSKEDYDFTTRFMGQDFRILRFATDGDMDKAADLLQEWDNRADAIGLGYIQFPYALGSKKLVEKQTKKLYELGKTLKTPFTAGAAIRAVSHEWCIRHLQYKFGNNYFNNSRVLFLSGMINSTIAKAISEYTTNVKFCDPILEQGIPKFLNSYDDLEMYAKGIHGVMQWVPSKQFSNYAMPLRAYNEYIIRQAVQQSSIVVIPFYEFFKFAGSLGLKELSGKIVITSTAYDDRVKFLANRGVDVVIDTTPKILQRVVGVSVLEALIMAALEKTPDTLSSDDILEVISGLRMDPRVVYPSGRQKRVNRFAFVVHPLSQEYLKKLGPVKLLSRIASKSAMDTVEKVMAYSPPFVYSKVTGIKSPTGVEAEGWLIAIGATPKQMLAHSPEFTNDRLLKAAKIAKSLGAQIMGLGALTKAMGDAGMTVAKLSDIPITTGNSYSASAALWAAADAVRRIGVLETTKSKKLNGKPWSSAPPVRWVRYAANSWPPPLRKSIWWISMTPNCWLFGNPF